MCGIVGYLGNKNCSDVLIDALSKLEYRGYDSAGIAVFEGDVIRIEKSKGRLTDLVSKLDTVGKPLGYCGIGHTRWATHGEPSDVNSHPHGSERVSIVHNGIIENYKKIKDFLISEGYTFESQTDTEVVVKLLEYHYKNDPFDAITRVLGEIEGSFALGIIFKDFPKTVFAVRKDSPLIVGLGDDENFIASDVTAILKYTKNYFLLEENEIAVLTKETADIFDIHGKKLIKEKMVANWDVEAAEKGGYEHFMLKEIYEQPIAIKTTLSPRIFNDLPDLSECGITAEMLRNFSGIHIVACGTAVHVGIVAKYVIEKIAKIPVNVDIASEFRYRDPILSKNDLVIFISQSGETADTKAALKLVKEKGIKTLSVVNVKGSSIARDSDMVLYTHAGPEISVASTKAYTAQLSVMYLFAFSLAHANGAITDDECKSYIQQLAEIPTKIESVLKDELESCQHAAASLINSDSLLYMGRGLDYALSMEGSLKLKEISYIHSESYAAGELKHGTISLITEQMPVIAVATQSNLFDKTVSNIKEVKARGAKTILVCKNTQEIDSDIADYVVNVPVMNDLLLPIVAVVPLQLIAYYTAVLKGCDVDKPRNLAKSVTVE